MKTICVRFSGSEVSMLRELTEQTGKMTVTASEFFRLLLHREWNRRRGLGKVKPASWQGEHRIGRPKGKCNTQSDTAGANENSMAGEGGVKI